jgi:hypothetical protein
MTGEIIAKALGGHKTGAGWTAPCPAHDDREPSLSVRSADGDSMLVRCHAGCEQAAVIAALRSRGLWKGRIRFRVGHPWPCQTDPVPRQSGPRQRATWRSAGSPGRG